MKRVILTILLSSLGLVATLAQSQLGMNYQAVIRDAEGKIIADKEVGIQVSILKESTNGTAVYTEAFKPKTNQFGLINLIIGKDQAKSGEYSSIDWSAANYFLKIELDAEGGTTYKEMGTSQLLSVPYANYAFNSASSWEDAEANVSTKNKVKVISDGKNPEAPLLEVVNAKGETIFAVYENGVKIILDEETGGEKTRGGFAISGRTTTKGEEADILTVTPSLTQVFVSETSTKTRGGFAISGRTTTKGTKELINVTPNETTIYVDEPTAKTRGGFAISGRTTTKAGGEILLITPSLTQFYVDENTTKTRGGFAISGRTTTKATVDLLNITPELTQFYVDENTTKTRGGFAISGRTTTKEGEADILTVTPKLTQVFVEESTDKTRGGFAISGRTTTKESGIYDVLTVLPERTDIYVKPSPSKNSLPIGFGVHGLTDNTLESTELFSISNAGTYVATPMAVSLNVTTGIIIDITQTSAMGGGKVADACCVTNLTGITSGIVYHIDNKLLTVEEASNLTPDVGGVISAGGSDDFSGLQMLNLKPGTKYKVRAFATDADGLTGYGLPREFTTLPASKLTINVYDGSSQAQPPLNSTVTLWKQDAQEPESISTNKSTHTFTLSKDLIYTYKVEADEYKSHIEPEIQLSSNQAKNIILTKAETGKVKVKFTAKNQYGDFVNRAEIRLGYSINDITNNLGEAIFYVDQQESIEYVVDVPIGYDQYTGNTNYTVNAGENNIPITLQKQHKVTFNVKDHNGIPAEQTYVTLTKEGYDNEFFIEITNGIGKVFLPYDAAGDGKWNYVVTAETFVDVKGEITVNKAKDEDLIVNVRLLAPVKEYTVKFIILDVEGNPLNGARVVLSNLPDLYNGQDITDADGLVTFTKVLAPDGPDRQYKLTVFDYGGYDFTSDQDFHENMVSEKEDDPIGTLTITLTITIQGV